MLQGEYYTVVLVFEKGVLSLTKPIVLKSHIKDLWDSSPAAHGEELPRPSLHTRKTLVLMPLYTFSTEPTHVIVV